MRIKLDTNAAGAVAWMNAARRRQLPFAAAKSLTQLADHGRDTMLAEIAGTFEVKNKSLVSKRAGAVRITPAKKRDWPNRMFADVHLMPWAGFLARHEKGGTVRFNGPHRHSIPTGFVQGQRCLLYTSPSPRDRTRSRMPSSA